MAKIKVTYTTLSADDPEMQAEFDAAIARVKQLRGSVLPNIINGKEAAADATFPIFSPIDTREPIAHFQKGSRDDARAAIAAAKAAFPAWRATPWQQRADLLDRTADRIAANAFELAAMMMWEMGKNRLEALGEVTETADLLRYYAQQMRNNDGYAKRMSSFGPTDINLSVLKPYGVWAVISPFNFPMALAIAPVGAALVTGNTVVLKPSSDAPWTCYMAIKYFVEEGAPPGTANFITGGGGTVGAELIESPDVDGITFTGSYNIGFNHVYQKFAETHPKPVVVEMGGKNPAIISAKADLDKATVGVTRSAFGLNGQKCSACSRVYVHEDVYDEFVGKLVARAGTLKIGDPFEPATFMGPVANKSGYEDYLRFMERARADGTVLYGGNALTEGEMAHGYFVEPAIITGLPDDHDLVTQELFVPILFVRKVSSNEEAMELANNTFYGLTAGFFGEDEDEVQWFLDNIEAGVVYVNRPGGATTGAWPGYQTFGGWKGSGSSGRNIGGLYSLLNYMREQSQTIIHEGVG